MREFEGGATRDAEDGKLDYEGFLNPDVLREFALYMHKHRMQPDGTLRASDNWQLGMPREVYMKSAWRHFHAMWSEHRKEEPGLEEACALLFNVMGFIHVTLNGDY